jgi:putative hydrolase of the HAD superfamily
VATILIFDGDNTLWDTNAVFRNAQFALLQSLADSGIPVQPDEGFETLRRIDKTLIRVIGNFEYDFSLLVKALVHYYRDSYAVEQAVDKAVASTIDELDVPKDLVTDALDAFHRSLREIPPLFPETESVLTLIRDHACLEGSVITVLFSEGNIQRLKRIFDRYGIEARYFFDEIVVGPKSKEGFEHARQAGVGHIRDRADCKRDVCVVIGDSLHRDVKYGNQAGCITIYKPAGFMGNEIPDALDEHPDYTIRSLDKLPGILSEIVGIAPGC